MIRLIYLLALVQVVYGWIQSTAHCREKSGVQCGLLPVSSCVDRLEFLQQPDSVRICIDKNGQYVDNDNVFQLCLIEEEDLPDHCRFVVDSFGADAIRISQDMNAFERMLISPAAELLNGYSGLVAFAEVFSGTQQRLVTRFKKMDLSPPNVEGLSRQDAIRSVEKDSLILALARSKKDGESKAEVIASVELRLQPCDAKIPFSLPWLDKVERNLASFIGLGERPVSDLQPYLSNLCVDERYRGKKIGKALVRCIESVAETSWGFNRMYLHVDEDNVAALSLYRGEGYRDVGHRWNPVWAGGAADIGYYVKTLKASR